ncbi:hypothetical protein CAPTEDRAFT_216225 [Capitella teleta]|uniref:Uncharacterized protein n=1 Tax=Capitella teleta TaxID=283909 RepID=R7VCT9_CAPTE|nr:hypothetical protein CAPTEDRAFT_216225 [Capitella teleta]|eukprot:ELU13495.1 hypothetical protein CAPTEDRAFT_216225 [Capitella teleta]
MDEDEDEESDVSCPEEDVTSGCSTKMMDKPQPKVRYRWSKEETKTLRVKFASYINVPSPSKRLPSKAVVRAFMRENGWSNIPYEKMRTKLMNEQGPNTEQASCESN